MKKLPKQIKDVALFLNVSGIRNDAQTCMPMVRHMFETLPELMPEVWDIVEPFKRPFSYENVEQTISSWPNNQWDFFWKRKAAVKAWGWFSRLYWTARGTRPAFISVRTSVNQDSEKRFLEYIKEAAVLHQTPYGYFDALVEEYIPAGGAEWCSFSSRSTCYLAAFNGMPPGYSLVPSIWPTVRTSNRFR